MQPEKNTEASDLQTKLLKSISTMQTDFIRRGISYGWCEDTIENLLHLSQSEFGFICELLTKADGTPFIKSHGITNIAWDDRTRKFYEAHKENGLEFFNFKSLWGEAVTTGAPVIANDPDDDERRGGYPKKEGHPILKSFLAIPVKGSDGNVVGVMGVANRPGGYDNKMVEFLAPFVSSYGMLIEKFRADEDRKRAEEKLIESEERFRKLFENMMNGFALHEVIRDDEGRPVDYRFLSVNPAFEKLTGLKSETILGQTVLSVMPNTEQSWIEKYGQVAISGKPIVFENYSQELDRHFLVTAYRPAEGQFACVFQDISDRKKAENVLKKQNYYLERAQELGNIGTWELDLINNTLIWTDENCRIFGVPEGSVVDYETFLSKVHPDDRDYVSREWEAGLAGKAYDIEHRLLLDDGVKWVREKADVAYDDSGKAVSAIGFTQDITGKKINEENLFESEAQFRQFFEHLTIGVAVYESADNGDDFIFVDMNPAGQKLSKVSIEKIRGEKLSKIFPGVHKLGLFKALQRTWRTGQANHVPMGKYADGRITQWVENRVFRLPSGKVAAIYDDRTEQMRMEEELRQAQKLESIGNLAGGIAHDFNNILYPIIGFAQLSQNELPTEHPVQENLADILNGALRARDLVKRILLFSRQQDHELKATVLQPLVEESYKLLRAAIPSNIDLTVRLYDGKDTVLCDPSEIHEIILNLCTNAHHAIVGDEGEIVIQLDRQKPPEKLHLVPGDYLCLSVKDNGTGIPDKIKDKIFEPYVTTKGVGKGSGLGLSVVYGIVQKYNGAIKFETNPETGTDFSIFLPISGKTTDNIKNIPDNKMEELGNEQILFVDDEASIVKLGGRILKNCGYHVTGVTNSIEAFNLFKSNPQKYDLVITDMAMPGMVGSELAERILDIRPDIPIVICSGYSEKLDKIKTETFKISAFLDKPLVVEDLKKVIRKVLDDHRKAF